MSGPNHLQMIDECLRWADDHDDIADGVFNLAAFENMRRLSMRPRFVLSPKQRSFVEGVHEKLFADPKYRNDWSEGRVPPGKPVATPAVLLNLPKKPPPRRTDGGGS